MNMRFRHNPAFTIVELLIVVVVIAILAAIVTVSYNGITNSAEESALKQDLSQSAKKLEIYKERSSSYPTGSGSTDQEKAENALSAADSKTSSGIEYNYISSNTPLNYCLQATKKNKTYHISNTTGAPKEGACLGVQGAGLNPNLNCPTGFIQVPGDYRFGTSDFCVAKYEMKKAGNDTGTGAYDSSWVPESRATGTPWTQINHTQALAESQTACDGCKLITEGEWMTIAANVLSVPSNWSGGAVGTGYIYNGHLNNNPGSALAASTNDNDGMNGITGGTGNGVQYNNRRTLTLTNGEVIWDLAGNVWEWTQGTLTGGQPNLDVSEWNNPNLQLNSLPITSTPRAIASTIPDIINWDRTKGIGRLVAVPTATSVRAFIRGGGWNNGSSAGVLDLNTDYAPAFTNAVIGFRASRG